MKTLIINAYDREYRGVRYTHCEVTGRYFCKVLEEVFYDEDDIQDAIDRHFLED